MSESNRPRLLDLYCGAGGAGMGYYQAGFDVTGIDINPQPRYPFDFIQGDAVEYLLQYGKYYDAIHASPPCQAHTALTKGNRSRGIGQGHADFIPVTRDALEDLGKPYVVENVVSSPIRKDIELCGLMFGLRVFRHRWFELGGWVAVPPPHPSHHGHRVAGWRHGVKYDGDMLAVYGDGGGKGSVKDWQVGLGVTWTSEKQELADAIPPAYTLDIGYQLRVSLLDGQMP